jgi:hypothetical protein
LFASGVVRAGFDFPLAGEGEHIRDRFLADPPSDASDPFVGVDGMVFSAKGLKLMSLTISQAGTEVSKY